MPTISILSLRLRERTDELSKTLPIFYLDFFIDGRSLKELLDLSEDWESDLVSCLCPDDLEGSKLNISQLLATEGPSSSQHVLVYVCPLCRHVGCGAYGVTVSRKGDEYCWEAFAYENGYEEDRLDGIGPFVFDRRDYETTMNSAVQRLESVPLPAPSTGLRQ